MATSCVGQPSRAILLLQMFTTRSAAGRGPSFAVEKGRRLMHFLQSPLPARRRPLSANEIAAIAVAVATACPAPRNVPGGLDRPRQVNGKSPRKQAGAVKSADFDPIRPGSPT